MAHSFLRRRAVKARTGLPTSTMYGLIAKNLFPKPVPLSDRAVGWIEEEVDNWVNDKIEASRGTDHSAGGDDS